jgi:formamidopyrimidine-DNA glycosylase
LVVGGHPIEGGSIVPNKFTSIIYHFSDGSALYFNSTRKFSRTSLMTDKDLKKYKSRFGMDPLERGFILQKFKNLLDKRRTKIKAFLLNQKFIAGIGNIYADEVCFYAGIMPDRQVDKINDKEKEKIFDGLKKILKKSINAGGTTLRDYVDGDGKKGGYMKYLKVHNREGEKCPNNCGIVKKIRVAGRGTYYCPKCQK